jgi:hypothetical protein
MKFYSILGLAAILTLGSCSAYLTPYTSSTQSKTNFGETELKKSPVLFRW